MQAIQSFWRSPWRLNQRQAIIGAATIAFIIFLTTLQLHINGSNHPYATDVGEIQNALPRWGTLHFSGYPQYSMLGSLFVTLLRPFLPPAISTSLFSAVWGVISIGLLVRLMLALDVTPWAAVGASILYVLSTSLWVDASIAEIHTMTMAITFATILAAYNFGRSGSKRDLYWFAFLAGQGLTHQRAFAFLVLGLLVFVWPQWRVLLRSLPVVIALGLLGPLTYLYLPVRAWMGAGWTFSSPGTWEGFRAIVLDTKVDRIIEIPSTLTAWRERVQVIFTLLNDDWPWPLWLSGFLGLLLPGRSWRVRLALLFSWLPYFVLGFFIWEGRISDALLAVKMPVIAIAAIGLAILIDFAWRKQPVWGKLTLLGGFAIAVWLFFANRGDVLVVTRDRSAFDTIALVERIPPADDGRSQTFMALWGHDYWALAYAQAYENKFPHLTLVDHDYDFKAVVEKSHLLTLSKTLYQRSPEWWSSMIGGTHLTAVAPEIIEIQPNPTIKPIEEPYFDLGNGIVIREVNLIKEAGDKIILSVSWQSVQADLADYSIGVHLVAQDPPVSPGDLIAQADLSHPAHGWYPTSRWQPGEVVKDYFILSIPPEAHPTAVRVGMYQTLSDGSFQNTNWLSLPVP